MKQRKKNIPLFAICIDNSGYPASLELHKIYRALPDDDAAEDGMLRVIDESGEDYLYSGSRFILMELPTAIKRVLLQSSNGDELLLAKQDREKSKKRLSSQRKQAA